MKSNPDKSQVRPKFVQYMIIKYTDNPKFNKNILNYSVQIEINKSEMLYKNPSQYQGYREGIK